MRFITLFHVMILSLLLTACSSNNNQQTVHPFVKGSFAHIQQQHQGAAYLVLFWSEDCAYCKAELTSLGQLVAQGHALDLVIIGTDPFLDQDKVRQRLASFGLTSAEAWVFSSPRPESLFFDVDPKWRGELPMNFIFDAANEKTKKMGVLKKETLLNLLALN